MIESVVALLMLSINGEIKEARLQVDVQNGSMFTWQNVRLKDRYSESVSYKCYKGSAELELNIDGSKSIKKLILE